MTDSPKSPSDAALSGKPKSNESISIALIEDNRVLRDGLMGLLSAVQDLAVVHAGSGADFARLEQVDARVVLLDLGLDNGDALELARRVGNELPDTKIIVMDLLPSEEDIREFVEAGVDGFVLKTATLDDLVDTVRAVAGGAHVLPNEITGTLFEQIASGAASVSGPRAGVETSLTPREREVIDLISEGLSNKRIAARLHISPHTVKSHVHNIMEKLALHTRLQLAAWVHHEDGE